MQDLAAAVAEYLNYGEQPVYWSGWNTSNPYVPLTPDSQLGRIMSLIRAGLRQFYFPPPVGGQSYVWSFLRPQTTVTLASGANTIDLPDDFGGLDGDVMVVTSGVLPINLIKTGVGRINQLYAEIPTATGQPQELTVIPVKGTGLDEGQRWQMYVYPTADQAYTLTLSYGVLADALSRAHPFAYGGLAHSETVRESCLAIAEERYKVGESGHKQKFMERLAASVIQDARLKPQLLGYNGAGQGNIDYSRRDLYGVNLITFGGVQY